MIEGMPDVESVAAMIGMSVHRRRLEACPSCAASGHGSGGIYRRGQGASRWHCFRCGVGGDSADLLAWVRHGRAFRDLVRAERREVLQALGTTPSSWTPAAPLARRTPQVVSPAIPELTTLRRQLIPVDADPEVAAFLNQRGLDVVRIAALRLAGALPQHARCPSWARVQGQAWTQGWRLVLPTYDSTGEMTSLRARWVAVQAPPEGAPKAVAVACGPGSASGMILANGPGQRMLATRVLQGQATLVVTEGETDYLTWAARTPVPDFAVFGLWSGAWSVAIASRVPDGARVIVRTDHDDAGNRYAHLVFESLSDRCDVLRSRGE